MHGLGEHIGRYERLISMLVDAGLLVVGFDLPGHGRSGGKRGHTSIEAVLEIIDDLTKNIGNFRLFGHSLGGLIAVRYAQTRPQKVQKLVLSSPALEVRPTILQKFLLNTLSLFVPGLTVSNGIEPGKLSRSKDAVSRYVSDPLVHDRISVKLGRSLVKNAAIARRDVERIVCPVTIVVGTEDVITPPSAASTFFNRLKNTDKKFHSFEGAYHEIFEDPEHHEEFHRLVVSELTG